MHCLKGVVNCLRALLIYVQIDQGRIDCMSEVNKSEQNLAYSRAVYLAPPRAELQNKTFTTRFTTAQECDPQSSLASDLEKQD